MAQQISTVIDTSTILMLGRHMDRTYKTDQHPYGETIQWNNIEFEFYSGVQVQFI